MTTTLQTEDIDIYASDNAALKQIPDTDNYNLGVKVNWTAPAKWWNWLANALTSAIMNFKADNNSVRTEIFNTLDDADIIPTDGTIMQLSDAIDVVAYKDAAINDAKPYVDENHKLVLPLDELLP